ncbi:MAG: hypothetical protein GY790_06135 [Bacteroidetes bacterium]|nr:hypothetical protein [Bacteroidota bacterium]
MCLLLSVPDLVAQRDDGGRPDFSVIIKENVEPWPMSSFDVIFKADMEEATPGGYKRDEWLNAWDHPPYENRLDQTTILEKDGSQVFKWTYPEGTFGPSNGGGQWEVHLDGHHEEIYMSYNMLLRPAFDFALSGKFPGLRAARMKRGLERE